MTTSSGDRLRRVRLGARERTLLLAAPGPEARVPGSVTNMLRVKEPERHAQRAALRAAWRLDDLGLVECRKPALGNKVFVILTDLGAEVVDRHRGELTEGRRIRWQREEG